MSSKGRINSRENIQMHLMEKMVASIFVAPKKHLEMKASYSTLSQTIQRVAFLLINLKLHALVN